MGGLENQIHMRVYELNWLASLVEPCARSGPRAVVGGPAFPVSDIEWKRDSVEVIL